MQFQSTLPVGGATPYSMRIAPQLQISIHAPRGGSDLLSKVYLMPVIHFNPRSPWGERRQIPCASWYFHDFNPRSPWGERLQAITLYVLEFPFQSTLPVGGATGYNQYVEARRYDHFNPRSPWGERLLIWARLVSIRLFQSTLPVGGATADGKAVVSHGENFNPRSPWGERLTALTRSARRGHFNPRSPWGERP